MAIQLAQTSDEFQRAFNVQSHSEIVSIRLVSSVLRSGDPAEYLKDGAGIQFKIGHKVGSYAVKTERILAVTVDCGLWALPSTDQKPPAESSPVLGITATFEATYELQEQYEPAPEDLKAFTDGNVVFNVWPFFRELCTEYLFEIWVPGVTGGSTSAVGFKAVSRTATSTKPPSAACAIGSGTGGRNSALSFSDSLLQRHRHRVRCHAVQGHYNVRRAVADKRARQGSKVDLIEAGILRLWRKSGDRD